MPIYEYKCQDCGQVMEVFVRSIHEKVKVLCSHCHSSNLKKIFSTPAAVTVANSSSSGLTCCA
ncbi:MAG: zinc ribbon domain-containing protein, partial [Candidatus Aminicenantales bacterium]